MDTGTHFIHPHRSTLKIARTALVVERYLMRFHRDAANRIYPYDPGISQLLDALATERDQQRSQLQSLLHALFGTLADINSPCRRRLRNLAGGHFFVIDRSGALTLLKRAARLEQRASLFYAQCADNERYMQLHRLYRHLARYDAQRTEVLMDAAQTFTASPSMRPLTA